MSSFHDNVHYVICIHDPLSSKQEIFSSNSKAFVLKILETFEKIFHGITCIVIGTCNFKSSCTLYGVAHSKNLIMCHYGVSQFIMLCYLHVYWFNVSFDELYVCILFAYNLKLLWFYRKQICKLTLFFFTFSQITSLIFIAWVVILNHLRRPAIKFRY